MNGLEENLELKIEGGSRIYISPVWCSRYFDLFELFDPSSSQY
jgi:hypothetical protein